MKSNFKYIKTIFFIVLAFSCGCKKFVSIHPPADQVTSDIIFKSDALATSTLTGIYSQMMNDPNQFTDGATTVYGGLSSDELQNYFPGNDDAFKINKISTINHPVISSQFWAPAYNYIYTANICIDGAEKSSNLTPITKTQISGEAKFVRAFCYFYLVNLFGDVPLVTTTNYLHSSVVPRTAKNEVYRQIIADLKDAVNVLPSGYPGPNSNEKTRPNKWAATALLSRVYLYAGDWINAESLASTVINSGNYSLASDLNKVFLKNSSEAIWQLQPVNPTWNTWEGRTFVPATSSSSPSYVITDTLLNSFESGDKRLTAWVGQSTYNNRTIYFPYKYKVYGNGAPITEYYMVLRLAELYLIRAEARAHLKNFQGAQTDLNVIRNRAGLPDTSANDQSALLLAIEQERKIELFAEWGHRWFDLIRTNRTNTVLGALKPSWSEAAVLWPIPDDQIKANPRLTQNPGY